MRAAALIDSFPWNADFYSRYVVGSIKDPSSLERALAISLSTQKGGVNGLVLLDSC